MGWLQSLSIRRYLDLKPSTNYQQLLRLQEETVMFILKLGELNAATKEQLNELATLAEPLLLHGQKK